MTVGIIIDIECRLVWTSTNGFMDLGVDRANDGTWLRQNDWIVFPNVVRQEKKVRMVTRVKRNIAWRVDEGRRGGYFLQGVLPIQGHVLTLEDSDTRYCLDDDLGYIAIREERCGPGVESLLVTIQLLKDRIGVPMSTDGCWWQVAAIRSTEPTANRRAENNIHSDNNYEYRRNDDNQRRINDGRGFHGAPTQYDDRRQSDSNEFNGGSVLHNPTLQYFNNRRDGNWDNSRGDCYNVRRQFDSDGWNGGNGIHMGSYNDRRQYDGNGFHYSPPHHDNGHSGNNHGGGAENYYGGRFQNIGVEYGIPHKRAYYQRRGDYDCQRNGHHLQNLRNEGFSNQFHSNQERNDCETRRGAPFNFDGITPGNIQESLRRAPPLFSQVENSGVPGPDDVSEGQVVNQHQHKENIGGINQEQEGMLIPSCQEESSQHKNWQAEAMMSGWQAIFLISLFAIVFYFVANIFNYYIY
ncbi:hypothetical protein CRE_17049 [Caenorhabditis remanei]|uniref:Uncharacterized protein n=1 Tax=Caenorhabditis remanei TaxID=31234 RepID=E3M9W4_CAERE|nr:hypothetical protein CRE_17049 [Caenorhabditis remanei]